MVKSRVWGGHVIGDDKIFCSRVQGGHVIGDGKISCSGMVKSCAGG